MFSISNTPALLRYTRSVEIGLQISECLNMAQNQFLQVPEITDRKSPNFERRDFSLPFKIASRQRFRAPRKNMRSIAWTYFTKC